MFHEVQNTLENKIKIEKNQIFHVEVSIDRFTELWNYNKIKFSFFGKISSTVIFVIIHCRLKNMELLLKNFLNLTEPAAISCEHIFWE